MEQPHMNADERRNAEAVAILNDYRKGRISARLRDGLLVDLGFEPINKTGRYGNNGGGPRHNIGAKG